MYFIVDVYQAVWAMLFNQPIYRHLPRPRRPPAQRSELGCFGTRNHPFGEPREPASSPDGHQPWG